MDASTVQKCHDKHPSASDPTVKQLRSYSLEIHNDILSHQISRERSNSGNEAVRKTPLWWVDDESFRRYHSQNDHYELSQDLLDKQMEMLERKYGGERARRAALTIQRAFRKYCMAKRFQELAHSNKSTRCISRRTLDLEEKDWMARSSIFQSSCVMYSPSQEMAKEGNYCTPRGVMKLNFASLDHELGETKQVRKPRRSISMRERKTSHLNVCIQSSPKCMHIENVISAPSSRLVSIYQNNVMSSRQSSLDSGLLEHDSGFSDSLYTTSSTLTLRTHPSVLRQTPNPADPLRYCTPRESVSSEDSGCSGIGEDSVAVMDHQLLGNLESSAMTEELQRDTRQWTPLAVMDHQLLGNLESSAVTEGLQRDTRQWTPLRSSDITLGKRRIPPKVPKRTSSVTNREFKDQANMINSCAKSVQSSTLCSNSGEGCEMTRPNIHYIEHSKGEIGKVPNKKSSPEPPSPVWKRKSRAMAEEQPPGAQLEDKRTNNLSENNTHLGGFDYSTPLPISVLETVECPPEEAHTFGCRTPHDTRSVFHPYKISEAHRKRQYRVGLNLFNKKPEKGIQYLIGHNYLEASPKAVAHFLISRKGLGKQSIGEYLGNLQHPFNMAVLECFVEEMDLAGMQVDVALRKFQTFFRMPGEAQKIERLVEAFSHHYVKCNQEIISKLHNPETIFVLAFAIIMLNTDLHTPSMRAEKRMKLEDFIKNVQGVDDGNDLDRDMLTGVYQRIKASEFKPGFDHVSQVMKLQQTIVGKKQILALPHRRLVCYCRLYEVYDINKKERPGLHQREVFLFNDMIMITKVFNKKKNSVAYTFRQSFPLCGLNVTPFETSYYPWGIRLCQRVDDKVVITLNARNGQDRSKFVDDLKESILEMDEMENMRIEAELKKQTSVRNRCSENRDSGVADVEIVFTSSKETLRVASSPSTKLNHSHLSNSLLDLYDYQIKPARRGSAGSLDSGMSISFSSSTTSTLSQGSVPQKIPINRTTTTTMNSINKSSQNTGFFGSLFGKKGKTSNRSKVY